MGIDSRSNRKGFAPPTLFVSLGNKDIDAILFSTNYLAISGLKAVRELNIRIGEDLSIIAYDDRDIFSLHTPMISAIEQPLEEIAENVINLALNALSGKENTKNEQVILPAKLIMRQ